VAGHLVADPDGVLAQARKSVARMQGVHDAGAAAAWLAEWVSVLDAGVDAVLDVLTSRSPRAVELRQNSPFAGVLTGSERSKVAAAFTTHWRRDHAARPSSRPTPGDPGHPDGRGTPAGGHRVDRGRRRVLRPGRRGQGRPGLRGDRWTIESPGTEPGRGLCLHPHDCVIAKLLAGRDKDLGVHSCQRAW